MICGCSASELIETAASPTPGVTLVEFPALDYAAMPLGRVTPGRGYGFVDQVLAAVESRLVANESRILVMRPPDKKAAGHLR